MQFTEYKKENRPILNQIYDILAELQTQDKKILHSKVPSHKRIKGNEEADKTSNRYSKNDNNKTTLYILHHQED